MRNKSKTYDKSQPDNESINLTNVFRKRLTLHRIQFALPSVATAFRPRIS